MKSLHSHRTWTGQLTTENTSMGAEESTKGGAMGQATWSPWPISDRGAKNFVKRECEAKQKVRLASAPQFKHSEVGVVVYWRFVQAGSPLRPNRAALRAAQGIAPSLLARLTRNHQLLWGKITVVDGKERLTPDREKRFGCEVVTDTTKSVVLDPEIEAARSWRNT